MVNKDSHLSAFSAGVVCHFGVTLRVSHHAGVAC